MDDTADPADRLIVDCPDCGGLGSKIRACECTDGDGRAVLDEVDIVPGRRGDSFDECRRCRGAGSLVYECLTCAGGTRVRAQIVLTVVNVDTGVMASATVIPGAVEPQRDSDHGYVIPLTPTIDELSTRCGVTWIEPAVGDTDPLGTSAIHLDTWDPDLPTDQRFQIEASAIAFRQGLGRHRVLIGRSVAPESREPDDALNRLCRLASKLHVDMTISRRPMEPIDDDSLPDRTWQVRFSFPDAPIPPGYPVADNPDLAVLIRRLRPRDLITALRSQRHRDGDRLASARWLRSDIDNSDNTVSVEVIASKLDDLCGENGAVAVWRDGAWHYTTLSMSGERDDHRVLSSGQIRTRSRTMWRMDDPPADPSYWGAAIPERGCAQCETGQSWVTCPCTSGGVGFPDLTCDRCGGSGSTVSGGCGLCGQVGRIREGFIVTVVDGDDIVSDIPFEPDLDVTGSLLGADPQRGTSVLMLPKQYRLAQVLTERGIDVDRVESLSGRFMSTDLLNGVVVMTADDARNTETRRFCEIHAKNPAARVFLGVTDSRVESFAALLSIAQDLSLDLTIYCLDGNTGDPLPGSAGHRWAAQMTTVGVRDDPRIIPLTERTFNAALRRCTEWLDHTLNMSRRLAPTEVAPAPQRNTITPSPVDNLIDTMKLLAARGSSRREPISVRIGADGVRVARHRIGTSIEVGDPIACAPTLDEAIAAARSALG